MIELCSSPNIYPDFSACVQIHLIVMAIVITNNKIRYELCESWL
jgi:hypothetical protein